MSPWTGGPAGKFLPQDLSHLAVDLECEDALVPKTLEHQAEPAKASDEVDEPHRRGIPEEWGPASTTLTASPKPTSKPQVRPRLP